MHFSKLLGFLDCSPDCQKKGKLVPGYGHMNCEVLDIWKHKTTKECYLVNLLSFVKAIVLWLQSPKQITSQMKEGFDLKFLLPLN